MAACGKKIPFTYSMMAIGSLAIIGAPYLAGYYSKEAILGVAYNGHSDVAEFAFAMGAITALLTAFYSARLFFLTFHGKPRGDHHTHDHAHESPIVMLIPLVLLSIGAIFSGYYGQEILGILSPSGDFWNDAVVTNSAALKHTHPPHWVVPACLASAALGLVIYTFKLGFAAKASRVLKPLYNFSLNKWYIDELYNAIFVRPYFALSEKFWKADAKIIDGMPNGAASLSAQAAKNLSKFQTGFVFQYAFVTIFSVVALISYYILF